MLFARHVLHRLTLRFLPALLHCCIAALWHQTSAPRMGILSPHHDSESFTMTATMLSALPSEKHINFCCDNQMRSDITTTTIANVLRKQQNKTRMFVSVRQHHELSCKFQRHFTRIEFEAERKDQLVDQDHLCQTPVQLEFRWLSHKLNQSSL